MADWIYPKLKDELRTNNAATALEKLITAACDFSMAKKRTTIAGKPPVHWWSNEKTRLRQKCIRTQQRKIKMATRIRRLKRRAVDFGANFDDARVKAELKRSNEEQQDAKRRLKIAILKSKKKCWTELIEAVETDPLGKPDKMVMGKLCDAPPPDTATIEPQCLRAVIVTLFPTHDDTNEPQQGRMQLEDSERFSTPEVNDANDGVRTRNKAPGHTIWLG